MTIPFRRKVRLAALAAALAGINAAHAAPTVDLENVGWVTYGDARSYSLPIAGLEVMAGPDRYLHQTRPGRRRPDQ